MRHFVRTVSQLVLACAMFLAASSAWADKPMDYTRGPFHFGPFPFFDCTQFDDMDFWIWAEGESLEIGKIFYDKNGAPTKAIGTSYTAEAMAWVPADPGCNEAPFLTCADPRAAMSGTNTFSADDNLGRPEHSTAIYKDWIYIDPDGEPNTGDEDWFPFWTKNSGLSLHIGIPGYGNVVTNAGTLVTQFNFVTFEWDIVKITPNWDNAKTKEVFAVCSAIGNR